MKSLILQELRRSVACFNYGVPRAPLGTAPRSHLVTLVAFIIFRVKMPISCKPLSEGYTRRILFSRKDFEIKDHNPSALKPSQRLTFVGTVKLSKRLGLASRLCR